MYIPVLREDIDSRRVVGAVSYIKALHLGHEGQEEAPDPLLALWKSTHETHEQNDFVISGIKLYSVY